MAGDNASTRDRDYEALCQGIVAELDRLSVDPATTVTALLVVTLRIYAQLHTCSIDSAASRLGDHLYQYVGVHPENRIPRPANELHESFRRHVLHEWFHGEFRDRLKDPQYMLENLTHVLAIGIRDKGDDPWTRALPIAVGAFVASVLGICPVGEEK